MAKGIKCPACGCRIYSVLQVCDAVIKIAIESRKEKLAWVIDVHEERCPKCDEVILDDEITYKGVIK